MPATRDCHVESIRQNRAAMERGSRELLFALRFHHPRIISHLTRKQKGSSHEADAHPRRLHPVVVAPRRP